MRARAETGNLAGAAGMLQEAPADCDRCLLSRARVAALSGDWRSADAWFTRAVAAAPSFPQPHHEWGQQLLRKGDVAGALNHAKAAARISPRFADAHLLWGEALLAAGDPEGAVAEIATAAKLTPRWGRLHLKWGEALAKLGQTDEARAKWREAAGMDLSAVDRARVQELLKQQPS